MTSPVNPDLPTSKVREIVEEYCSTQLHPSLPRFKVHGPFTRDALWKSEVVGGPGCYVIYSKDGSLLYIGMSVSNVGKRIGRFLSAQSTRLPPHYFDVIEVTYMWQPPSLEEYIKYWTSSPG
jgi:hypothetical protein